jgi:hypothetical protein
MWSRTWNIQPILFDEMLVGLAEEARLSHTKLEDTKPEHLELSVQALDRLATKTVARYA